MTIFIEYVKGSKSGRSFYLTREISKNEIFGYKISGTPCKGKIKVIKRFKLNKSDLEFLIQDASKFLNELENK